MSVSRVIHLVEVTCELFKMMPSKPVIMLTNGIDRLCLNCVKLRRTWRGRQGRFYPMMNLMGPKEFSHYGGGGGGWQGHNKILGSFNTGSFESYEKFYPVLRGSYLKFRLCNYIHFVATPLCNQ